MPTVSTHLSAAVVACSVLANAGWAQNSDTTFTARSTGLPTRVEWKFNFDAGLGMFGFANSLYTNPRPDPSGDLSENWLESFAKPALSATYGLNTGELYGAASVVGERTFSAPPPLVGDEASSFHVEDLYLGWRSGTSLGLGDNALDLRAGRSRYQIGRGFILSDGGGEGGTRGGYWSNARKAWEFSAVARFAPKRHALEAFYLDRDEVPERETGTRLWGANYELSLGEENTIGASYLALQADSLADRDGMSVYNLRAYLSPFKRLPDLSFGAEYALEDNGDRMSSTAWIAQVAYQLSGVRWQPTLGYRYSFYEGDDPATAKNEAFDSLLPGFYDWGTWWQGEIAGGYFLSNSNLISHQARLHLAPNKSLGTGLIGFIFQADQPASYGPGVTSRNIATELDAYADVKLNSNFSLMLVAAYGNPQDAVAQASGRTKNFTYGMIYVTYPY